jgi:basic membrane lipoprotein Med (substrate-binding protein (PBP1-ABC) superfamily)
MLYHLSNRLDLEGMMTTLRKLALTALLASGLTHVAAAEETKLGFINVGPAADFGYNTSMDLGRKYLEQNARCDHDRVRGRAGNR